MVAWSSFRLDDAQRARVVHLVFARRAVGPRDAHARRLRVAEAEVHAALVSREVAAVAVDGGVALGPVGAHERDARADGLAVAASCTAFGDDAQAASAAFVAQQDERAVVRGHEQVDVAVAVDVGGRESACAVFEGEGGALVGSPAYHGGDIDMGGGHLHPLRYAFGLARAAAAAGVRIHEGSEVRSLDNGSPATIRTDTASIRASHVLLACNGYLGTLDRRTAARVMPINNFIVATEPLTPDAQEEIVRGNHAVADTKFVINYFRFSEDHRLLFGGGESYGYRFPDIAALVRKPMLEIFPQLAGTKIDFAWGGTLGITLNRMPDFARIAGNVLSVSGFSGHGVALATLGGKLAAEAIAGQAERFDLMATVPTRAFPGGVALRWPLLVLAMVWFSLRDRL